MPVIIMLVVFAAGGLVLARTSYGGSPAGVLLLSILQNLINQVGTLGSYAQQLVSGVFLIVVVVAQAYLTRKRPY